MAAIVHELTIEAPAARVFEAIATQEGLRAWWTKDTEAEPRVGSTARFGFHRRSTVFRMTVKALDRGRRVVWRCQGGHREWKGTRVTFELTRGGSPRETVVRFVHAGWRSSDGWLGPCSYTWAQILARLKRYVETGRRVPYFTE